MKWQIEGYAARWGVSFVENYGRRYQLEPGCFSWDPATAPLWFMHDPQKAYLAGERAGLQIWQDQNGLAFRIASFAVVAMRNRGIWLADGIGDGRYCEVSASFYPESSKNSLQDGETGSLVSKCSLVEISICPKGACPGTGAWFSANGDDLSLIPANIREACATFHQAQVARPIPPPASWAAGSPSLADAA